MRPRADEVLRSVLWTFDAHLAPAIQGEYERSLARTTSNLLRHVLARLQHEGQALWDGNAEIRRTLADVLTFVDQPLADMAAEATQARAAIARTHRDPQSYPTLASLTDEAADLRAALSVVLLALQRRRPDLQATPGYADARTAIRSCLRHQLERERAFITEAFTGDRR